MFYYAGVRLIKGDNMQIEEIKQLFESQGNTIVELVGTGYFVVNGTVRSLHWVRRAALKIRGDV